MSKKGQKSPAPPPNPGPAVDPSLCSVNYTGSEGAALVDATVGPPIPEKKPRGGAAMTATKPAAAKPKPAKGMQFTSGKSKAWKELRNTSLYELAKRNIEDGTVAEGLEFLRRIWQDGLMVCREYDDTNGVFVDVVREVKDQRIRVDAWEKWQDRITGRPVQQVEHGGGTDDGPLRLIQNNISVFVGVAQERNAALQALIAGGVPVGRDIIDQATAATAPGLPG